jgi:predicted DNA-binding antitoxin AbrB/MazE fold protein
VTAVYQNGVLRPTQPLPLTEGETVEITLERRALGEALPKEDEIDHRIRAAKTLEELFAAAEAAAELEPDDGYDLLQALNENRRLAGEARPLFPPEMKGITW